MHGCEKMEIKELFFATDPFPLTPHKPAHAKDPRQPNSRVKILEPAPQGMGAPPATGNTQGNAVEAHRSLPEGSLSPPRIHLMPATMVSVAYYTTRSHPDGGLRRIFAHRKQA